MNREVTIQPEAQAEIQTAFDWYEEQSEGLGFEFLRVADACVSGITRNPFAYPVMHETLRRALLRRFPYALFYLVEEDKVVIIACFHTNRHPIDWLRRD